MAATPGGWTPLPPHMITMMERVGAFIARTKNEPDFFDAVVTDPYIQKIGPLKPLGDFSDSKSWLVKESWERFTDAERARISQNLRENGLEFYTDGTYYQLYSVKYFTILFDIIGRICTAECPETIRTLRSFLVFVSTSFNEHSDLEMDIINIAFGDFNVNTVYRTVHNVPKTEMGRLIYQTYISTVFDDIPNNQKSNVLSGGKSSRKRTRRHNRRRNRRQNRKTRSNRSYL
jgi:hypothetical protein